MPLFYPGLRTEYSERILKREFMTIAGERERSQTTSTLPQKLLTLAGALVITLVAVVISLHPFLEPDIFWQLRVGHGIVATGRPPHHETYSWDRYGARWSVSEWLGFVGYYEAYRHLGGFAGLLDLRILLNVAAFLLQFAILRRLTKSTVVAFLIVIAAETASANFFQTRPYQFTFVLSTLFAYLVARVRSGELRPQWLLATGALTVVWANLHQGFILEIIILLTYTAVDIAVGPGCLARGAKGGTSTAFNRARWSLASTLTVVIGSLVSPYGVEPYGMIAHTIFSPISRFIIEWMPLSLSWSIEIAGLASVAVAIAPALTLSKKRDFGTIAVIAGLAVESLLHQRNVPLFALMAPILAAPQIGDAIARVRDLPEASTDRLRRLAYLVAIATATWNVILWTSTAQSEVAIVKADKNATGRFWEDLGDFTQSLHAEPEDAAAFMQANGFPSKNLRLFNDLGSGGYFLWRMPTFKVFIDSRNDPYMGGVLENYYAAITSPTGQGISQALSRYDFDGAVTHNPAIQRYFAAQPGWVCVYTPSTQNGTWIDLRRSPRTNSLIEVCLNRVRGPKASVK